MEIMEKELAALEQEQKEIEAKMNSGNLCFDELNSLALRVAEIISQTNNITLRWMELSEKTT